MKANRESKSMSASSIGIQIIMPKTGTSPKTAPQQQANDREASRLPAEEPRAPPPPGMGKLVDKVA